MTPISEGQEKRKKALEGSRAYFSEGRCSGHAQFNGRYCRDVAGPEQWCIHCAGYMLAAELRGMAWQPIDTAPKDGTPIITYGAENGDEYMGYFRFQRYNDGSSGWAGGAFLSKSGTSWVSHFEPSLWMPAIEWPAPPASEGTPEGER